MRKILSFVLILAVLLSSVPAVIAYEEGDPCLLYGYDPDTRDDYVTYGDEVFLRYNTVKSPTGDLNIILNPHASKRIIDSAETYEKFLEIVSEDYFPELDIGWLYCETFESSYNSLRKSFPENYRLYFSVQLKDNSKETVTDSLIALAPRNDIDIEYIICFSYDLTDVSTALKIIAGWDVPRSFIHDYNRNGEIDLSDVAVMLKAIARWENKGWFLKNMWL